MNRPEICFVAWEQMPDNHGVQLRVGQMGFRLANDGIAAHEIAVEDFEIEPGVWFTAEGIARIREKGEGFALVWRKDSSGFAVNTEKWDLLGCMRAAAAKQPASAIHQMAYHVKVGAIYRDSSNVLYRSCADLIFIPSQRRLKFGPTVHERIAPELRMISVATENAQVQETGDRPQFTDSQRKRLDDASKEMNETFHAYEQMRDLLVDPEWERVGPPSSNTHTMPGEISTLERDLRKIALTTVRVYAESCWGLGSVDRFRTQLQSDARVILKWIFATVKKRMSEEDTPLLKWDAIEQVVHQEVADQIQKAEREWEASPPWKGDEQVATPKVSTAAMGGGRRLDEGSRQSSGSNQNDRTTAEGSADSATGADTVALSKRVARSAGNAQAKAERAVKRQAVVNPILQQRGWRRGRLVTEAGVGKNSVYQYLDGTRAKITDVNRKAIAGALGLEPEQLPD